MGPSGKLTTAPIVTPEVISAVAFATARGPTRRGATLTPTLQNPPEPIPTSSRAANIIGKFGAKAAPRFATNNTPVSIHNSRRRSTRAAASVINGAANAATSPGTVTIRPPVPSDTPKAAEMLGRRPIGRNSEMTSVRQPAATAITADQDPQPGWLSSVGARLARCVLTSIETTDYGPISQKNCAPATG